MSRIGISPIVLAAATLLAACKDLSEPITGPVDEPAPAVTQGSLLKISITPLPFTNFTVSADGMSVSVYFTYTGTVWPVLTAGTGSNIFATSVGAVTAQPLGNNIWWARIANLIPGTLYYLRLDDGNATWYGSQTTLIRDVVVDFYRVDIITDGDDYLRGCGDFYFTFIAENNDVGSGEVCLNDGESWTRTEMGPSFGKFHLRDFKRDHVTTGFFALDSDLYNFDFSDCGGMQSAGCGDLAYGYRSWSVVTEGTVDKVFSVTGEGVNANALVHLTVSYHN